MIKILLDTTAYSAFKKGHAGAVERLRQADEITLTPIVLGELHAGFRAGSRFQKNEEELQTFLSNSRVRLVPMDEETARRYGLILDSLRRAGAPVPTNDLWIAASAMQHGLAVLTSDAHFKRIQQILVENIE